VLRHVLWLSKLTAQHRRTRADGYCSPLSSPPRYAPDVLTVLLDQLADLAGRFRRFGAGIGHGAAETHVIADVVYALGILEDVLDVELADAIVAVQVASVVRFAMIAH
jgi:hypothetical protein